MHTKVFLVNRLTRLARTGLVALAAAFLSAGLGISSVAAADVATKNENTPAIPWKKVPDAERKVLAPVEPEWSRMSGGQQRKLLGAAKEYPKLSPTEQARFQERLKGWSSLSPEQRKTARDKYQTLQNLPPEKQQELKSRWQEKKQEQSGQPKPDATQAK